MDDLTSALPAPTRRSFLGGIAAAFTVPFAVSFTSRAAFAAAPVQIGAFLRVDDTNTVTLSIGSAEMGQGIMTGLAQLVAEQLQVDWSQMKAEHAIGGSGAGNPYANPLFHAQITGGSTSMMGWYNPMRTAAATVRDMLIAGAAAQTGTTGWTLATGGRVTNGSETLTFAQVAASAASITGLPTPALATTTQFIGKPMARLDTPAKVNGSAVFGMDVQVPGMVFASVVHCPTLGGTVGTVPKSSSVKGVTRIINLQNAVAVIAGDTWTAMRGAKDLEGKIKWVIPTDTSRSDTATLAKTAQALLTSTTAPAFVAERIGEPSLNGAAKVLDQTYSLPFLAHACMEVLNCTAAVTADKCEVWAPTQGQEFIIPAVAAVCGLTKDKVILHTTYLGGGFGRKIESDYVLQAVNCAKELGVPVKLMWSREQDFQNDRYRPSALIRVQAALDGSNAITSLIYRNVSPSIKLQRGPSTVVNPEDTGAVAGAKGLPYAITARQIEHVALPTDIPLGYWRSVGESYNTFAVESAIDELAKLAGIDPITFRRDRLSGDARAQGVLTAVETLSGWKTAPAKGSQRGVAVLKGFGSYVAMVAEVTKTSTGTIKVTKVSVAVDCGVVINPDQVEGQMQGGIAHGLAAAMWHQATFVKGKAQVQNFDRYPYYKLQTIPAIAVKIVASTANPGGVGETAVPVVAPAVANAWAKLTGTRLRSLPFYPNTKMGEL